MMKTRLFGGVASATFLATLLVLTGCTQNFFEKQYFRSVVYYFPDANLRAFAEAAAQGKTEVLDQMLADKKVEVDQRGTEGVTALGWAIGGGSLAGVDWLLTHGANPDRGFYETTTPLTLAVLQNQLDIVKRLLRAGAQPDLEIGFNRSPLGKAVTYAGPEVVEALLQNGANPNGVEGEEGRPLLYALNGHKYDTAAVLLENKASPRYLPEMAASIVNWMDAQREKHGAEPGFQKTEELLTKAGVKLNP